MASPQQKAFWVLEFAKTNSVVTVQRAFRRRFGSNPPCPKNIRRWFRQFQESGCLCKGRSPGRPRVSEEQEARIRAAFERSPRKSTDRASRELAIPQSTVWRVLTVRLHLKPYRLQLVQALTNDDKRKRMEFCDSMLEMMEDETFMSRLIFSDEATFHLSGTVNLHNVRIWGTEHPHETVEHERDFPKVNVICAVSGPLRTNLDDLKHRITTAINSVHRDMLIRAWEEFSYRIDVTCSAGGGHIEHL
ncbi:hypothetical protein B7P43_G03926 [Cryptotermes secundus]|uniref:Uncharacterized protein n=1 Tax=Cryptotermes secundus TaxID=105785 RepID=A0A2J7RRV8_9NEOP|nr:hypothetical protein B7P43_G03926 [Cryptotermes secundus]